MPKSIQLENRKQAREGFFVPSSVDEGTRSVTVCWTTGQRVQRRGFQEELAITPESVRLQRLNAGAPLLNSHQDGDIKNQIGVVERAWIEGNEGKAVIRFSKRKEADDIFQDVKDGVLRNISVGYTIHKAEEIEKRIFRVTDWEPCELSLVPVPADSRATIRGITDNMDNDILETESNVTEIREQELNRIRGIEELTEKFSIPKESKQDWIKKGFSIEESRGLILDFLSKKSHDTNITRNVETIRDENETKREGIVNAILHRQDPGLELNENGRRFRNLSLLEMARDITGGDRYLDKAQVVTRAFHSTSDFPEILGNAAKQKLLLSFQSLAKKQNFWPLARIRSFSDFKPMRTVRMGELPSLSPLPEGAEYTYGTLGESSEEYAISTFGKALGITRQMIINDDLGAFDTIGNWGGAISRLESALFWNIFNANPNLSDGKKLFSKEHKNRAETSSPLSIDALSAARIAMSKQQGLDKREDEYLDITADFLIVPIELQTKAEQFLSREVVPQSPGEFNPFKGAFQLITTTWLKDPNAWYLTASQNQGIDLIEMAYLDGKREPYVEWKTDFDTDSLKVKVRMDLAAKPIDYRGMYQGGYSK